MNIVQYRVLEYAQSETERFAKPFLVVLRVRRGTLESYGSMLLDDWKSLIPEEQQADIEYVEDVLYDFRQQQYMEPVESQSIFDGIAHLSSGPIRTGSLGECQFDRLDQLQKPLFDDGTSAPHPCTAEYFAGILALLQQSS